MPDATPSLRSKAIIAVVVLCSAVAAGYMLFVDGETDSPAPATALPETTAINRMPAAPLDKAPAAPSDVPADPTLADVQTKIERLEQEIASLREHRNQIDTALAEQTARIDRMSASATASPAPAADVQETDPGTLDEDLELLGTVPTDQGHLLTLGESMLRFKVDAEEAALENPEALQALAETLGRHERLLVRIESHTDNKGHPAHNLERSHAQARSVKDALAALGVAPERMQSEGLGDTSPVNHNRTVASRARNRRVEIVLIEP